MLTSGNITDYPLDITSISLSDVTDGTLGLALVINLRQFIVDVLSDFNLAWPGMMITIVSTAILSFLIILLMRFLVWIIVPLGIILCVVAVGALVAFAYYEYAIASGTLNVTDPITAGLDQIFMERLRLVFSLLSEISSLVPQPFSVIDPNSNLWTSAIDIIYII